MKIFDTHAHLLDEAFDADRDELIASLPEKGVTHVMEARSELSSFSDAETIKTEYVRS